MTFDGFMVWSNLCPSCYGNTGRLLPFSYLLVEKFSCSAIFSKREFAVVSNLRFSRTNFMLSLVVLVEHEKTFYNLGARSNLLVMYGMLHCFSVSLEQIQLIKPMLLFSGFLGFFCFCFFFLYCQRIHTSWYFMMCLTRVYTVYHSSISYVPVNRFNSFTATGENNRLLQQHRSR